MSSLKWNKVHLAVIFLLSILFVVSFYSSHWEDKYYEFLLKNHLTFDFVKNISLLLFVLLPIGAYVLTFYLFKDENISLTTTLLFLFSFPHFTALFSPYPLFRLFDSEMLINNIMIPFALIPIFYFKENRYYLLAVPAIAIYLIFPNLLFIVLPLFAAVGISKIYEKPNLVIPAVFLIVFINLYSPGELVKALLGSFFMGGITYVLATLHQINKKDLHLFFFSLMFLSLFLSLNYAFSHSYDFSKEIEAISSINFNGTVGVLTNMNMFEYYSGIKPELLNSSLLLKNASLPNYVFISRDSLLKSYPNQPIVFRYITSQKSEDYPYETAVFANFENSIVLYVGLKGGNIAFMDARAIDLKNGNSYSIPFTNLKLLFENSTIENNLIINRGNIEQSSLIKLLFNSTRVYDSNGVLVLRTR